MGKLGQSVASAAAGAVFEKSKEAALKSMAASMAIDAICGTSPPCHIVQIGACLMMSGTDTRPGIAARKKHGTRHGRRKGKN